MNSNRRIIMIASSTLIIGVVLGWLLFGNTQEPNSETHDHAEAAEPIIVWTCSMHPQIRKNEGGKCPICGMDLIPLEGDAGDLNPMAVSMSPTAMQLAHVQTMVVGTGDAEKSIRLNGKVQTDERLLFTQSSHIPGRIEKLAVNFTGDFVSQGQVIAYVYSPDLVTAQEELFEASKIKETQPALFKAAVEKLKNWKLTDNQIEQIITSGKTIEQFPVLANVSGYVTKRMVNMGDYVKRGEPVYEIADLSKVWILFDVYESDMTWVKKGALVSYTVQSIPGKFFKGVVSYLDPVIDPKTRVAKARIEVNNPGLMLKPEMFASGTVESKVLSKSSSITVPKTAVMWTGKRSVVYVMQGTTQGVSFLMREVILGPELGESYVIESGLQPGEEIALHGTFSIDAAAQLAGKPSMMNPEGDEQSNGSMPGMDMGNKHSASIKDNGDTKDASAHTLKMAMPTDKEFKMQLTAVYMAQLDLQRAFLASDVSNVQKAVPSVEAKLAVVDMRLVKGDMHDHWMVTLGMLSESLSRMKASHDIEQQRLAYADFNDALYNAIKMFGTVGETIYYQFCPMARKGGGAYWLSATKEIQNPYYGDKMLSCGETKETLK